MKVLKATVHLKNTLDGRFYVMLRDMEYSPPYQKTRMSQSLVILALQCEMVNPKSTQEGEEYL